MEFDYKIIEKQLSSIEQLLRAQLTFNKSVLSVEELSHYTGFSVDYIYKLTYNKIIPFSKPSGKVLFFDREKIDAWLLSNPSKTHAQLESSAASILVDKNK